MLDSPRLVMALTALMVVVFAVPGWVTEGIDSEGLALELALIAANTLPLLLIRRNPLAVVLVFSVTYPTWLVTDHWGHILQSLPTSIAL